MFSHNGANAMGELFTMTLQVAPLGVLDVKERKGRIFIKRHFSMHA